MLGAWSTQSLSIILRHRKFAFDLWSIRTQWGFAYLATVSRLVSHGVHIRINLLPNSGLFSFGPFVRFVISNEPLSVSIPVFWLPCSLLLATKGVIFEQRVSRKSSGALCPGAGLDFVVREGWCTGERCGEKSCLLILFSTCLAVLCDNDKLSVLMF